MAKKTSAIIGIEYDHLGIRAARLGCKKVGPDTAFLLEGLEEKRGEFVKEDELVKALRELRESFYDSGCTVSTCVSGKQVFAAEVPFRSLPDAEMRTALKFELRKNVPFELGGSTLEYQVMGKVEKDDRVRALVAASWPPSSMPSA